jgi:hypothetical protein
MKRGAETLVRILALGAIGVGGGAGCGIAQPTPEPVQNLNQVAQSPCNFDGEHLVLEGFPEYLGQKSYFVYGLGFNNGVEFGWGLNQVTDTAYKLHPDTNLSSPGVEIIQTETDINRAGGIPVGATETIYSSEVRVEGDMTEAQEDGQNTCILEATDIVVLNAAPSK